MSMYRAYFISGPQRRPGLMDKLRLAAAGLIGLVVVGAALILSLSLLLILIPVGLGLYLFRRPLMAALLRRAGVAPPPPQQAQADEPPARAKDGVTIDGDYVVIERDGRPPRP